MNAYPILIMGLILVFGGLLMTYKDKILKHIREKTTDSRGRGVGRKIGNFKLEKNRRGSIHRVKIEMDDFDGSSQLSKLVVSLVVAGVLLIVGFNVFGAVNDAVSENQGMNTTMDTPIDSLEDIALSFLPIFVVLVVASIVMSVVLKVFGRGGMY